MSSEIRLTPTSYIVLGLLDRAGEATPYDLKQAVGMSLGNFWSLPHAQLYAEPERLAAAGLLNERREDGGRRRRHYRLTPAGKSALEAWLAETTEELTELRDLSMLKIFFGADPQALATVQLPARLKRIAEYEETVARIEGQVPQGIVLALRAGIAHEQEWARFFARLQAGEEGA